MRQPEVYVALESVEEKMTDGMEVCIKWMCESARSIQQGIVSPFDEKGDRNKGRKREEEEKGGNN